MKYVVLAVTDHGRSGESVRHVPIIFPDLLVHSEVSSAIARTLRTDAWENGIRREVKPLSAGFLSSTVISAGKPFCHGKSESLNLPSRPVEDSALISTYDYLHGIQ